VSANVVPSMFDVTESDFNETVLRQSHVRPVIVDFWAPWCQPCRMLGPVLERLVAETGGEIVLAKVNTDEQPGLAAAWAIQGIPAVKAFRDGDVVLEFVGLLPEAQLRDFINRLKPTDADRLAAEAARLETTDAAGAEAGYRRALEADPRHPVASLALARRLLERGQGAEAEELLNRLDYVGPQADEAERLRAILALHRRGKEFGSEADVRRRLEAAPDNPRLRYELGCVLAGAGHYSEALETLLSAAAEDRDLARGPVREEMVQIFQAVGVRNPLSDEYRDKLARLLY